MRAAAASGGVWNSLKAIGAAEGIRGYWRGNLPQVRSLRSPFLSLKRECLPFSARRQGKMVQVQHAFVARRDSNI